MKPIIIIFAFCFLLFTFQLSAGDTWIKTYEPFGDVDYYPEDIVVCQDGGYAVNGYYNYYDPYPPPIDEEWGFLMKTDSDGNLLWAKLDTLSFMNSNRSYAFVETSDSGFISGISSGILIKRDYNGNKEWAIDEDFAIHSMCNTDDGNIILGGFRNFNIGLRKIDEDGNTLWTQIYTIDDDYSICKSIIQTNDGGYALTGYLEVSGTMTGDIIVMKTDSNGDSLWTRTYDGYGLWDIAYCIAENCEEDLFVSGYFTGSSRVLYGVFIKISNSGDLLFLLDENICGYNVCMRSMVDDLNNNIIGNGRIGSDLVIHAFNYSGENQWNSILPFDYPALGDRGLQISDSGFIVYGGNDIENNISIVKTNSQGLVSIEEDMDIMYNNHLCNYPNPFNLNTTISFELHKNGFVEISIYNLKGQKIKTILKEYKKIGNYKIIWDGFNKMGLQVSSGIYFLRMNINEILINTHKLLIIK